MNRRQRKFLEVWGVVVVFLVAAVAFQNYRGFFVVAPLVLAVYFFLSSAHFRAVTGVGPSIIEVLAESRWAQVWLVLCVAAEVPALYFTITRGGIGAEDLRYEILLLAVLAPFLPSLFMAQARTYRQLGSSEPQPGVPADGPRAARSARR